MKKIAVVSSILENPKETQLKFNDIVSDFKGIIKGRMGLPFEDEKIAVISIVVTGTMDEINEFTGRLGMIENVTVKTAISKKEY